MSPPKKNTGCGCGCSLAVLIAFVGLPTLGYMAAGHLGGGHRASVPHRGGGSEGGARGEGGGGGGDARAGGSDARGGGVDARGGGADARGGIDGRGGTEARRSDVVPPGPGTPARPARATTAVKPKPRVNASRRGAPLDDPFYVGYCAASPERSRPRYQRLVGGAAPVLRGKVVIVHLLVDAPGVHWTDEQRQRAELSSLAVTNLYQREAARYGITDLDVRTVPWPLSTSIAIPSLTPGERDILPDATARALEAAVRKGLLSAEHETLDSIARSYHEQGYDAVAFIAYLPATSTARSFASPHGTRDASAEMAFVFDASSVVAMSSVAAHEGLHLFGADDLYRLTPEDAADDHDIMSACRGFLGNGIEEATAWAIGWEPDPPSRRYRF